jgi:hypothetical protein
MSTFKSFCIVAILAPVTLCAQSDSASSQRELLIERLLEHGSEDSEDSPLMEELDALALRPLNLNSATLEELVALPFLAATAAASLHAARCDLGGFSEWSQVLATPGIDESTGIFLRLYTYLSGMEPSVQGRFLRLRSRFQQDDRTRAGYLDGRYQGPRWKSYQRATASWNEHLHGGVLIEKDPGETSLLDHITGYVCMDSLGAIERLIVGDFTVNAGQGLVLWKRAGLSKGGDAVRAGTRGAPLIQPSISASEYTSFRGAAVQTGTGVFRAAGFVSVRSLDGRIDSVTGMVTSFDESGLHRTAGEMARENTISERTAGANLSVRWIWEGWQCSLGCTGVASRLDRTVASAAPHSFAGSESNALSVNADLRATSCVAFAEWARSHTGSIGGIAGITAQIAPRLAMTAVYRGYQPEFVSRFGYGFGDKNGATQNEEGIYLAIRYSPFRGLVLQLFHDAYRFPGQSSTMPVPSSGHELQGDAEWKAARGVTISIRCRQQTKDVVVSAMDRDGRAIRPVTQRRTNLLRVECLHNAGPALSFRLRIESTFASHAGFVAPESGSLAFADVQFAPVASVRISARAAAYRTDSWDSRLYMYEPDVQGAMSNTGFSGQGMHFSVMARCSPTSAVTIGMKYGQSIVPGTRAIGVGDDAVPGDAMGRMSFQLDLAL